MVMICARLNTGEICQRHGQVQGQVQGEGQVQGPVQGSAIILTGVHTNGVSNEEEDKALGQS